MDRKFGEIQFVSKYQDSRSAHRIGAADVMIETNLFIAGKYVKPAGDARFVDIEPATERELAQVADASSGDIEHAVAAAREAADRGPWPRMSAEARGRILDRMADGIERRARDLGGLEA